jgi:hypothetical protein
MHLYSRRSAVFPAAGKCVAREKDSADLPNRLERAYFGEGAHAPLDA